MARFLRGPVLEAASKATSLSEMHHPHSRSKLYSISAETCLATPEGRLADLALAV